MKFRGVLLQTKLNVKIKTEINNFYPGILWREGTLCPLARQTSLPKLAMFEFLYFLECETRYTSQRSQRNFTKQWDLKMTLLKRDGDCGDRASLDRHDARKSVAKKLGLAKSYSRFFV